MSNTIPNLPLPPNEPVKSYAPGSVERAEIKAQLDALISDPPEIPLFINGEEVRTGDIREITAPHDHSLVIARAHMGGAKETQAAIDSALAARKQWAALPWHQRASVFLKAAQLLAGKYRALSNATTMLQQSKNVYQAEIDSACELIDFWRLNSYYARGLYEDQPPHSPAGVWNRVEMRGLEGFIFAVTPFNFTSIAGNLPTAPALMGNVAVWKPAKTQVLSAWALMQILREAGLPAGVVNMVLGKSSAEVGKMCLGSPDLAGVHFTGSTSVFQMMYRTIGENIASYKGYPRIVGETGGKDFVFAHQSADAAAVITALSRGAFEYQGQKCSAASRAYIPASMWDEVRAGLQRDLGSFSMGSPLDFRNFINAVIDESAFDDHAGAIEAAKKAANADVIIGGEHDKSKGYFVQPTVIQAKTPDYATMQDELFGPILTAYVYDDDKFAETLEICDQTSPYALTGAIFAQDRHVIEQAETALVHAAGNFYINDKPTGAVVGQQPFGGGRASGTNDKAGSWLNLIRWASPRAVKENLSPPTDYRYPFLAAE